MKPIVLFALSAILVACGPAEQKRERKPIAKPAGPTLAGAAPAPPAWASAYMGKIVTEVLPEKTTCVGNTENTLQTYAGPPAGVEVGGWGYDRAAGKRIERILIADESLRIVGAGESGLPRDDVTNALPEIKDPHTGWKGAATVDGGDVLAFGLVDNGQALCPLGRVFRRAR